MTRTHRIEIASFVVAALLAAATLAVETVPPPAPQGVKTFMLLLHDDDGPPAQETATEHAAVVAEYATWARAMAEQGKVADGAEVRSRGGKILRSVGGKLSIEERTEVAGIDGYFLIKAEGYDEAVRIASSCPHLGRGGWIEVRLVEE